MNFIIFHSEKNFIISGVCLSGVCIFKSLSCQEFVFQEFVMAPLSVNVNVRTRYTSWFVVIYRMACTFNRPKALSDCKMNKISTITN